MIDAALGYVTLYTHLMNPESSASPAPSIAKPLLLEALGKPLLAYIVGTSEKEIDGWLAGGSEDLDSPQQTQALRELMVLLQAIPATDQPELRYLNLSHVLGLYQEQFHTTLVNAARAIATGETPVAVEQGSVNELLRRLTQDVYPLYLLPRGSDFLPTSPISLFSHPLRPQFESVVLEDDVFCKLFTEGNEHSGKFGYAMRSTGQGGGVQISMFASVLIGSGWRQARISNKAYPTVEQHINATLVQLGTVHDALTGKPVTVPARVAFTGVRLVSDQPLDLGWGVLRQADDRDQNIPGNIEGQLSGTGSDGNDVVIDYSGNVILETPVPYRLIHREFKPGEQEWPKELRAYEDVQKRVESVQLGALLSQEYKATEPITVMPTWRYIHDPLAHGYQMSWSDPKMNRGFMPKQLNKHDGDEWKRFAILIHANRTKYVDVAISRTLSASIERRDFVDVLVDSVIAWENLVGSQKGEPTLRVSGALAWLLEPDGLTKRTALKMELGKLYHLRSQVVHGNDTSSDRELALKSKRAFGVAVDALRVLFTDRQDLLKECRNGDDRSNRLLMGG